MCPFSLSQRPMIRILFIIIDYQVMCFVYGLLCSLPEGYLAKGVGDRDV